MILERAPHVVAIEEESAIRPTAMEGVGHMQRNACMMNDRELPEGESVGEVELASHFA
jgi:hypothetical protein